MKFVSHRVALSTIILSTLGLAAPLYAYGSLGHEIVGAIAGERLANTVTATKIRALLDGLSLEKAGMMPDEIKGWDKNGVDDPKSFHYARHPKIARFLASEPADRQHEFSGSFASLVSLCGRASGAGTKIRRGQSGSQQMGHRPYDSLLSPSFAGTSAGTKRAEDYETRCDYFTCSLCR